MIYSDERSSSIIGLMSRRRRKSDVAELLFLFVPFKAVKWLFSDLEKRLIFHGIKVEIYLKETLFFVAF